MTARVCFQVIVWNGMPFLEAALKSIIPYAPVVAVEGPVKYFADRGYKTSEDGTNEVLHDLLPANMIFHADAWAEKDAMCNAAIPFIPRDTTHLFCVDSDEIWRGEDLREIFANLDQVDSVNFKPLTFFGGFSRLMGGYEIRAKWTRIQRWYPGARWETHRPPTINSPYGKPWRSCRHWDAPQVFHHYSYVYPSQVKAKIGYYQSWGAGTIHDYFNRVFRTWVLADEGERQAIEDKFHGVHEFAIARRGDARTYPFLGEHPPEIQRMMPALQARFEREVEEMREGKI